MLHFELPLNTNDVMKGFAKTLREHIKISPPPPASAARTQPTTCFVVGIHQYGYKTKLHRKGRFRKSTGDRGSKTPKSANRTSNLYARSLCVRQSDPARLGSNATISSSTSHSFDHMPGWPMHGWPMPAMGQPKAPTLAQLAFDQPPRHPQKAPRSPTRVPREPKKKPKRAPESPKTTPDRPRQTPNSLDHTSQLHSNK